MIKAIFFDYDGVLTIDKTGSLTTTRYLSKCTGLDDTFIRKAFSRYNDDLNTGKITHRDIWRDVCNTLNCEMSLDWLRLAFESTPMNDAMFSLARRLRANYRLGIITDNKKDRIAHLRTYQGLDLLFDPILVSAEFGSGKDSAAIFTHALDRLEIRAEESVFIDNSRQNLAAPLALGMKTIFHDDEQNDVEALTRRLTGELGLVLSGTA